MPDAYDVGHTEFVTPLPQGAADHLRGAETSFWEGSSVVSWVSGRRLGSYREIQMTEDNCCEIPFSLVWAKTEPLPGKTAALPRPLAQCRLVVLLGAGLAALRGIAAPIKGERANTRAKGD